MCILTRREQEAVREARLRANIGAEGARRYAPGGPERDPRAFRESKEFYWANLDEIARIYDQAEKEEARLHTEAGFDVDEEGREITL